MSESRDDGSIAPRRGPGGPILPPPPPDLGAESRKAEESRAEAQRAKSEKQTARTTAQAKKAEAKQAQAKAAEAKKAEARAAQTKAAEAKQAEAKAAEARKAEAKTTRTQQARSEKEARRARPPREAKSQAPARTSASAPAKGAAGRTRRAQLRLVQIDAWSVMKTAFLLSIALGIVLVVAVAIIWSVLGRAGVWESINSIVQQAVGGENGEPFDIEEYAGTSRVLGFTMIVAVLDVILITAIATLGAFLYNLSAALLGGIEVTFAEDH